MINVLLACEESQAVCIEMRKLGLNAYSCDLYECSGNHPEWHIQGDVLPLLDGNCSFTTQSGSQHTINGKWDLIIAFPPCIYLTSAGNRWFNVEKYGEKALERKRQREEAADFFMRFVNADCDRIAIENPLGYMNSHYRKSDQVIHPYYFGEPVKKRTCLWLKGLPQLKPTNMLQEPQPVYTRYDGKPINWTEAISKTKDGQEGRSKARARTFNVIAAAMANQWGNILLEAQGRKEQS